MLTRAMSSVPPTLVSAATRAAWGRLNLLVLDDHEGILGRSPGVAQMKALCDTTRILANTPLASVPNAELADIDVIFALRERTRFSKEVFARLPSLRLLLQSGGHAYHVDVEGATQHGVQIVLGRGAQEPLRAVPELVFNLMTGCLRDMKTVHHEMTNGAWNPTIGRTLAGRTMGLLGAGRHGGRVATIAKAFGMKVIAWDRGLCDRPTADGDIPRFPMEQLLAQSDVVSIHLKLSDESRNLIDAEKLAQMKRNSILINTSRGAIVDEKALADALADPSAPLSAAGLDVFHTEPLPADSPLRSLPNALITPHIGFLTEEVFMEFAQIAANQLKAVLEGTLPPSDILNPM